MRLRTVAAAYAGLALAFCGCGQGHQPVYPVHGEVRVGGQARYPCDGDVSSRRWRQPRCSTSDRPGGRKGPVHSDQLRLRRRPPAGEYRVTVAWFLWSGRPGDDSPPANYLPARYARPETTPLHAVVRKGVVDLQPFVVQAR